MHLFSCNFFVFLGFRDFGALHVAGPYVIARFSDFLFPLQPPPPLPRQTPRLSHPEKLDFGPFRLRLAPFRLRFGSVWGLFRVRFGSFSGCWVGSGRGGVGERGFCKGKEYH